MTSSNLENIGNNEMFFKVEKINIPEDGLHIGIIEIVAVRHEPYHYLDLTIKLDNAEHKSQYIKVSYPARLSCNSSMGRLLVRFGQVLQEGQRINIYSILNNKKVSFLTMTEVLADGRTFARIIKETLRPYVMQQHINPELSGFKVSKIARR